MKTSQVLYKVDLHDKTGKKIKTLHKDISGSKLRGLYTNFKARVNEERIYKIYKKKNTKKGIEETLHRTINLTMEDALKKALKNIDFYWAGIDVDYERDFRCNDYGCDEEGICRCSSIYETEITSINVSQVVERISYKIIEALKYFELDMDDEILEYCLDRYLRRCGIENKDNYYIDVRGGYYGDEINGVYLEGLDSGASIREIAKLIRLDSLEAVKMVLNIEYGFLTDFVEEAKKLYIVMAPTADLKAPNQDYCKKLNGDLIEEYKGKDYMKMPVGMFREHTDCYKLIDGYHRFHAMMANSPKECKILVLE
jgi:hypothetical protein